MGTFSPAHWLVVLFWLGYLATIVHVAVSERTRGRAKLVAVLAAMFLPWIGYFGWLAASRPIEHRDDVERR
jgi:hypothetical protein